MEIFKNLNSRNFWIYWCTNLKLAEIFKYGVTYNCVEVLSKKLLIQIFDDVIGTMNSTLQAFLNTFDKLQKIIQKHLEG